MTAHFQAGTEILAGPGIHARVPDVDQYIYVDTAFGGVNRRNKPRKLGDVRLNGLADCYVSHNRATEALVAWVESHENKDGNPTVAGFDGETWAPDLHLDFDAEGAPGTALAWLLKALDRLEAWGVDLSAVRIYFSGNKGFHLEIPHTLFGGFHPSKDLHVRLKRAAARILGDIPFDPSVYDTLRLWRIANSRNGKTGLYKIRLTPAEARTLGIEAILELATAPRDAVGDLAPVPDDEWMPVDELVGIWADTLTRDEPVRDRPAPREATGEARARQTAAAIEASWPHGGINATEGERDARASRHADYLLPICGFLAARTSPEDVVAIVAAGAEHAGDRSFLSGRDWRAEIARIVEAAAARTRDDQPVKGLPSLAGKFPALANVLGALWPDPTLFLRDDGGWFSPDETQEERASRTEHQDAGGAPDEAATPPAAESEARPTIRISGKDPKDIARAALAALKVASTPEPRLFVRGGQLARVLRDEGGRPLIQTLTKDGLLHDLTDAAVWERYDARSKGWKVGGPPDEIIRYVGAHGSWPLPPLVGMTETPVLRPDGTIVTTPGYDPVTRLVYTPSSDLRVPEIPATPTEAQVVAAVSMVDELLGEFACDGPRSEANARGLLVTLVTRPAINGQTPLAVIDKNSPGAGATLLTEVLGIVANGRAPGLTAVPTEDAELEKRITTLLRDGEPFNVFDNVDHPLEHGSLALVLTATEWAGRILGRSETARYPNRAVWSANGNNLVLRGDIARRSYQIRMVAEDAQPWRLDAEGATRYRHPRLAEWAAEHRGELLAAVLTLARNWYAKGCPEPSTPQLGKFEDWCRVVGGILESAGITGFLGNLDELYSNVDAEAGEWEAFLSAWFDAYGSTDRSPSDVKADLQAGTYPPMVEALPGDLAAALSDPRVSFERKLGRALAKRADRRYGDRGLHLVRGGSTGRPKWRVEERGTRPPSDRRASYGGYGGFRPTQQENCQRTESDSSSDSSIEGSGENPHTPHNSQGPPEDGCCPACRRDLTSDELPCPVCVEVTA